MNKKIPVNLNKLIGFIFPERQKYFNEKRIYYIRLYTDLIRAEDYLTETGFKKSINFLMIIRNMTKETEFKEEEVYFKRINEIVNGILSKLKNRKNKIKNEMIDHNHLKTKLQLAQNICILRVLKR